jgi:colanic acid/amylovoran biosynthesis protein
MIQTKYNNKVNIALLWHSLDSDNLGVGALAIGHLFLLEEIMKDHGLDASYTTIGTPATTTKTGRSELETSLGKSIPHETYSPRHLINNFLKLNFSSLKIFKSYDIVFDIGEGDSFTDIYGSNRFLRLFISKLHVVRSKKPLIFSPQTIGPFNSRLSQKLSKYILSRHTKVFSRDNKSTTIFREMLPEMEISQVIDVALAMPYEKRSKSSLKQTIGINVSGLLMNGGYSGDNQFNLSFKYSDLIKDVLEYLQEENKYDIELVPHVISDSQPWEDDYEACKKLAAEYKEINVSPKFTSPIQAKSYISGFDLFIGSRMHATIAALATGVPVIPLAYSRKFAGLFGTLNYSHTINLIDNSKEKIIEDVIKKLNNVNQLKNDLTTATETYNNLLNKYKAELAKVIVGLNENN